jgi:WD40 repeat protein/serine/threonine protein kinase
MENLSGQSLKGYELSERIGAGGFGAVYKAHQSTVGRQVAIKIILPGYANKPDFIRRFEMEAQIIARLEHPFIVPLHDYWRDPNGAYLVMRWYRGGSLQDALKTGTYDVEATARLLDQVCGALEMAHRHDVIHRDIKPGNILLDEDGNAYLADFGIAKELGNIQDGVTKADAVMGSPQYISPEQARSEPISARTDIYSLGVVIYEMLEGKHPFPDKNVVDVIFKHISDPLPAITKLDDNILGAVNEVIQKTTAKNPEHRYPDALSLAAAFRQAAAIDRPAAAENLVEQLTRREQEVLKLLVEGKSNKQIANELFVEISTVKWYNTQIYGKLGVRSRMQAVVRARELNLVVDTEQWESGEVTAASSIISLPEPENPYKGLRAFEPADHRDFFGRENLTKRLLERMEEKDKLSRFLAVVGPSGSGKSSLAKAGLIPALWRGDLPGSDKWYVVDVLPGTRPLDKLEVALTRVAANQSANLHEHLIRDEHGLSRIADLILPDDGSELVIIIDQFEEVFTLVEDEAHRQKFLDLIRCAITGPRSRVRVVVTLRADFYDRPLHYPEFGELMRSRMETVLPLTAQGLEKAITGPAERVGVTFEEGLVAQIVSEMTYQAGALPLLQYAMTELFEQRQGRLLTHKAYQDIGGAVGALAMRAEETYNEMPDDAQECARQMFLRLVTLGEGAEDTRRRVARSELLAVADGHGAVMEDIIDIYAEYRLLSLDNDPATRSPTVEVAHEAVLREWERLRNWLNESRGEIRLQRQLAHMTSEWNESNQDKSFLVRGSRLAQFEVWAQETQLALTPRERAYLKASAEFEHERREHEDALKQRAQRVLQALVVVFLIAAIGGIALSIFAFDREQQARDAEYEARRQASIGLASQARLEFDNGDQDRAVLLALEALEEYPYTSQAESALADVVESYIPRSFNAAMSAAWSPDGQRIALSKQRIAGDLQDVIAIMDADTDALLLTLFLDAPGCEVHDMAWSPDGDRLVGIYRRGFYSSVDCLTSPTIWDTHTGEVLLQFTGHEDEANVLSVDWSPDGSSILTAGDDSTARIWEADTGMAIMTITGHTDIVFDADWSPAGNRIATASADGTARIWDALTGNELLTISKHTGGVTGVAWSPDGARIVTVSEDGLARVWDAQTGDIFLNFTAHTDALTDVQYSPDGLRIATHSESNETMIWDASTSALLLTFPQSSGAPGDTQWGPNNDQIFTMASIWDISSPMLNLSGHTTGTMDGEWSPDGSLIATVSMDNTARIWDAFTGEELHVLNHPNTPVYFSFSPDGTRLVTSCFDGIARIWDVFTGELLLETPLTPPETLLFTAVWSPDGSRIVSVSIRGDSVIWDANTGETLVTQDTEAAHALQGPDEELCILFGPSWSPDSDRIATGCAANEFGTGPLIWDADTGVLLMAFEDVGGQEESTLRTDWLPDGFHLVTGHSSGAIRVWNTATGELLQTFSGHTNAVSGVSWSPDGQRVASGDQNGIVKVWDANTGHEVRSFQAPGQVPNVNWSPAGTYLIATGEFDTPVIRRVWPSTEALIEEAKACCVTRQLTPEEREQFGLPPREE